RSSFRDRRQRSATRTRHHGSDEPFEGAGEDSTATCAAGEDTEVALSGIDFSLCLHEKAACVSSVRPFLYGYFVVGLIVSFSNGTIAARPLCWKQRSPGA